MSLPRVPNDVLATIVSFISITEVGRLFRTAKNAQKRLMEVDSIVQFVEQQRFLFAGWVEVIRRVAKHPERHSEFINEMDPLFILERLSEMGPLVLHTWMQSKMADSTISVHSKVWFLMSQSTDSKQLAGLIMAWALPVDGLVAVLFHPTKEEFDEEQGLLQDSIPQYVMWMNSRATRRRWRLEYNKNLSPLETKWREMVKQYKKYERLWKKPFDRVLRPFCAKYDRHVRELWNFSVEEEVYRTVLTLLEKDEDANWAMFVSTIIVQIELLCQKDNWTKCIVKTKDPELRAQCRRELTSRVKREHPLIEELIVSYWLERPVKAKLISPKRRDGYRANSDEESEEEVGPSDEEGLYNDFQNEDDGHVYGPGEGW